MTKFKFKNPNHLSADGILLSSTLCAARDRKQECAKRGSVAIVNNVGTNYQTLADGNAALSCKSASARNLYRHELQIRASR